VTEADIPLPETVSVALRGVVPGLAVPAVTVTVAELFPDAGDTVSQSGIPETVQEVFSEETWKVLFVPAEYSSEIEAGSTERAGAPAWEMVTETDSPPPEMVRTAERAVVLGFCCVVVTVTSFEELPLAVERSIHEGTPVMFQEILAEVMVKEALSPL